MRPIRGIRRRSEGLIDPCPEISVDNGFEEEFDLPALLVDGDDRAFGPVESVSQPNLMSLAFGDDPVAGQTSIVIEQQMQFYRSFGPAKPCPVEHLQTEIDHRCVQQSKPFAA